MNRILLAVWKEKKTDTQNFVVLALLGILVKEHCCSLFNNLKNYFVAFFFPTHNATIHNICISNFEIFYLQQFKLTSVSDLFVSISSAPALSSRGQHKATLQTSADDRLGSPWKAYSNGERIPKNEFDDSVSFGVATPLLKSFMTQARLCDSFKI